MNYQSHGEPLETYELTRRDHHAQKQAESIRAHVDKLAREWRAEEAADADLRRSRQQNVDRAWKMINASPTPGYQIMRWRVRLFCGHIVETSRHCDVDEPRKHGASSMRCPECGLDPAAIVAYAPIGRAAQPPNMSGAPAASPRRPTRQQLEKRVKQLEAELAELRRQAAHSRTDQSHEAGAPASQCGQIADSKSDLHCGRNG